MRTHRHLPAIMCRDASRRAGRCTWCAHALWTAPAAPARVSRSLDVKAQVESW